MKKIDLKNLSKIDLKNLSKREQSVVGATVVVISIFILVRFIFMPIINEKGHLQRKIKSQTKILERMSELEAEYLSMGNKAKSGNKGYGKRPKGFRLFSFLEKLAQTSGVKDNIGSMKPTTSEGKDKQYKISIVEVRLKGVDMKQLIRFLHGIETSKNMVHINRISITKQTRQKGSINAIIMAETIEPLKS